ncbi:MFS-type transporter SLC18B1 isoform X2 [Scyliorhinus canicula]|uniref:MFS-type transporter SLC18B1 isoform X2 n=1 Tax=Scyliorhinus canicula TaxID=7830 RepID=UPI0018F5AD7F|nr:MFS-type transporter SLC18B1 isoform X2 [Scyliorhinus canicula]
MASQGDEVVTVSDDQNENSRKESQKWTRNQIFTLASVASLNFSSMICYSCLGPFFPKEAEKKGASATIVGMIFGCFALIELLFSLILGKYIVQIGAKFMFLVGLFISGWCTILFGLLDKVPDGPIYISLCFIVRSMDGMGFSGSMTASFSILAATFPNNVGTIMGLLEIFAGLGLILGPPVGGFLYQSFGYEVPFFILGSVVLLMVPLNMCILQNYDGIASKESFWNLITIPKIALVCLLLCSISSCIGFLDPTVSLFVTEKFGLQPGYVGLVFLGFALSYAVSSPLLGYLSDRIPRIRKWLMLVGSWLIVLSFFLLGPAPIFHIKCENGFEEGLGTLGLVSGMFGASWSLGSFIGPTLGGYLLEKLNFEWAAAIQGGVVLVFSILMSVYFLVETMHKRRSYSGNSTDEERAQLIPD